MNFKQLLNHLLRHRLKSDYFSRDNGFLRPDPRRWTKSGFLAAGLAVALLGSAAASDDPEPRAWPERLLRTVRSVGNRGYLALTTALFEQADEIGLNLFDFPGEGRARVKIHRDVFDNFDPLNTYTVIDRVQLRMDARPFQGITTLTQGAEITSTFTPYASFIFEPQGMIEWMNVRPVEAFRLKKETKVSSIRSQAESFMAGTVPDPEPDPDLSEMNPDFPIVFRDPSLRAKFSKILNLGTFPFRLPLSRRDVRKMKDGEILGYAFDGQVEMGLGVGVKVTPMPSLVQAGLGVRGTVILHGRYQIAVLREDERFARVKITRLGEHGKKFSVHAGSSWQANEDGTMVFRGEEIDRKGVVRKVVRTLPFFSWEMARMKGSQFDAVYRYDLHSAEARRAFHRAVLGGFGPSEELAEPFLKTEPAPGQTPVVQRMLSREAKRETRTRRAKAELSYFLKLDWNRKRESLEAKLELPDGSHIVHQAGRETKKSVSKIFSSARENRLSRMTLMLDEEKLAKQDPEAIYAITEFTDEDSNTSGRELRKVIGRMEARLRKPELLPTLVTRIPKEGKPEKTRATWTGRSSFYYGYSLSTQDISDFLTAHPGTVREAAAKSILGEEELAEFEARWSAAAASWARRDPPRELFQNLRRLFADGIPIDRLTEVIFDSLPGRSIHYFVTAQNVTFGTIQEHGKTVTSVEKILTLTDRELGWNEYSQRLKQDSEAITREMRVVRHADGWGELHFTLAHRPEHVFFRLYEITGFRKQKRIAEIVINNRSERFVEGVNRILLDPESLDALTAKLSRSLRQMRYYSISIGYSRGANRFGPVSTTRFDVDAPYPERDPEPEPTPKKKKKKK